jgi:hypothetical protein
MYVFIDDSGDTGFKFDSGSSTHFVVAGCVFRSSEDVSFTAARIQAFRADLGWHVKSEFKHSKASNELRLKFLRLAAELPFALVGVRVDKTSVVGDLGLNQSSLLVKALELALTSSFAAIRDARVFIDGQTSKQHRLAFSTLLKLRANQNQRIVSKVRFVDSKSNDLIQLSDMIAGALRREGQSETRHEDIQRCLRSLRNKPDSWVFDYPG